MHRFQEVNSAPAEVGRDAGSGRRLEAGGLDLRRGRAGGASLAQPLLAGPNTSRRCLACLVCHSRPRPPRIVKHGAERHAHASDS